jgi:hypothetical protein
LLVERSGNPISKSALDSAWQRFITEAMRVGVITESERFALHGLKHRGITESKDKASGGHRTERCGSDTTTRHPRGTSRTPCVFRRVFRRQQKGRIKRPLSY